VCLLNGGLPEATGTGDAAAGYGELELDGGADVAGCTFALVEVRWRGAPLPAEATPFVFDAMAPADDFNLQIVT